METLKEAGKAQGRRARVQVPALRRELQRREAGKVAALFCLAWCAHEPARSCSKFMTPGSVTLLNMVPYCWPLIVTNLGKHHLSHYTISNTVQLQFQFQFCPL